MKIGVVGYSAQKFDEVKATSILRPELVKYYQFDPEVVSGLTSLGIPKIAYTLAEDLAYSTAGIACKKALDYGCWDCDKTILIGDNWGDESPLFISYCDIIIRVGGGKQSMAEAARAKELGKYVVEYDL